MRLIDIDAIVKDYTEKEMSLTKVTYYDMTQYSVDAIPIEWIENYVADHWKTTKLYATDYVWKMLENWEKENEID